MPRLGLPEAKETVAFRAFDAILREDDAIRAAGVKILSWTGDRADNAVPTASMCPMVRISPKSRPDETLFERSKVAVLGVEIEACAAGFDVGDILNLWGAIRAAFLLDKPFRDTTVACYLRSVGVDVHRVEKPAIGDVGKPGDAFMAAVGEIVLKFIVPR